MVAILLPVVLGFAALAIDIGYLYVIRTQLQTAADAAALAGATAYLEDSGLLQEQYELTCEATQRAQYISQLNETGGQDTLLDAADVTLGQHDFDNPTAPLSTTGPWNAVELTVYRTPDSLNGPVRLFFAGIFGMTETDSSATARAAMDDHFSGYRLDEDGVLIPFTVHEALYADMLENGPDDFSYDGDVKPFSDGIREIKLFPWKFDEPPAGAGNFGILNVGIDCMGVPWLESQILNGISAEQLQAEFGTSELVFYDEAGDPRTYDCTGNPGYSLGMRDALETRLRDGDVVGFFLHQGVVGSGANATYAISGIRFGRIVEVQLTGNPNNRTLSIQPVPYTSRSIIVDNTAPSTDGLVVRLMLVK